LEPLSIDGAWVFAPRIFHDSRGSFLEWYRSVELDKVLGYQPEIAQANCSVSRRGVIRGIHFADLPPGQAKYVTCVSGAITDIVVDIRVGSPTYGRWEAVRLDDTGRHAVFLAEGLGHAFVALTDDATVMYLCSTPYAPGRERGVHPFDPAIGIVWPAEIDPVLSEKDASAPTLEQARSAGLLPGYRECVAYSGSLRRVARGSPSVTLIPGQAPGASTDRP
jgi:dTDP-4-dehydrorhamnose 3,5-epimerase